MTERLWAGRPEDVRRAAELLRGGQTVAFATETVYGLGANALDAEAVERIFVAKQRPYWDPLIVHLAGVEQLGGIVSVVSEVADKLMQAFWPGPLTLLLPRTSAVPDIVTAGRDLVGVRMPAHAGALELLRWAGVPVAAPSANTFGHTSPTTAGHVLDDLDGRIAAVLDGGATEVGVESTVVEVTGDGVVVYRPGAVTVGMLEAVVKRVEIYEAGGSVEAESLPSPGVGIRHYAPRARLVLVDGLAGLVRAVVEFAGLDVGVMLPDGWMVGGGGRKFAWGPWDRGEVLARRVFLGLRALDDAGVEVILCPVPEGEGIGRAVRDRLWKAAREK